MNEELAQRTASLAVGYAGKIRAVRDALPEACTTEKEIARDRDGLDQVLEHLKGDILAPVLQEHPDLEQEGQPR
jgi:hypothetical protein